MKRKTRRIKKTKRKRRKRKRKTKRKRRKRKTKRKKGGSSCIGCLTNDDKFNQICDNIKALYILFIRGLIDYEGFLSAFDNIIGSSCKRACIDDINYNLERKNILHNLEKKCVERNNSGNNN